MKIAFVTTSFPRSPSDDAGIFVARLVGALEEVGVDGIVIAPKDKNEEYQPYKNFKTIRVPYTFIFRRILAFGSGILPNIKRNPWAIVQIPGLLFAFMVTLVRCKREYELIHANWLINVIPSVCVGVVLKKPVIVTARGEDLRLLRSRPIRALLRPFLAQVKSIVVVGESLFHELGELIPTLRDRMITVENGVQPEIPSQDMLQELCKKFALSTDRRYLISVGSVIPRKRIDDTITILSQLKDRNVELLLCGRLEHIEYVKKCRKTAECAGVLERVKFLGTLSPSEVWGLLALSTVFVSSSEFEGRPNAMLEALSVGVPVIASKIPAHESVVSAGQSGYLFSSSEDAAKGINDLLGDREKILQFSDNARKSMDGRGWRNVAEQYLDLYKSKNNEKGGRGK